MWPKPWQCCALVALIMGILPLAPKILAVSPIPPGLGASAGRPDRFTFLPNGIVDDEISDAPTGGKPVAVVRGQLLIRFRPGKAAIRQQSVLNRFGGSIRYFRSPNARALIQKQSSRAETSAFEELALMTLDEPGDLIPALHYFRQHPAVLYAEPNYRLQIAQATPGPVLPNDFDFAQLWGLHNVGQADGTEGADMGMAQAWQYTTGNKSVVLAVIDTGIDYYHPDLEENIWVNPKEVPGNGLDDDGNGYVDDYHGYDFVSADSDPLDDHGHGTHVAGTIGAVGNNGVGVAGVCWQAGLMAIKVFDEAGNSELSTAIEGIRYAIENGAHVINASWGNNERSRALADVIREAHNAGVLFVAAAGNDNSDNLFYPAAYDYVVGVAATNAKDQRSRFSDYGSYVDVAAPGENIFSTLPNNSYGFFSGTSMATPHVVGVAALVLSRHPEFSTEQLENILRNAVEVITPDKYIGTGRINAAEAVRVNAPLPQVKLSLPETISGEIDVAGTATGADFVSYSLEYGKGPHPTNWTSLHTSATPVPEGTLLPNLSTPLLGEGTFTFRLMAQNASGERAVERASVHISNVHIASPMHNDVLRAGEKIKIMGTVFGGGRSYRLEYGTGPQPVSWSDAGIELASGGSAEVRNGVLAVWDTGAVQANQFYTLKLTATAQDNSVSEFLTRLVYLDSRLRPGWPQHIPVVGPYPPEDWRNVTVADIDLDGFDEIMLVDHGNSDGNPARLLVFRYDGSLFWSKELASGAPYADIPVVGDVDRDGFREIFVDVGEPGQLFAFRHDGTLLPGKWPVSLEAAGLGKALADLDGDGFKEVIGYSEETVTREGSAYRQLVVFDRAGNLIRSWEVLSCDPGLDVPRMLPAVGNLDEEPDLEVVAVSGCAAVSAFKLNKASGPLWTADSSGTFASSPVIGDLNGNRTNEVIIAAFDLSDGKRGGVYAFDNNGKRLPGWPMLVEESFSASPALADTDGDGRLEISLPSWKSGLLHLLRSDGFEMNGWPVGPVNNSSLKSSTVIGDIDGDGQLDIVLSSPGHMSLVQSAGDLSQAGGVKAWDARGRPIALNGSGPILALVMESSGGSWLKAPPVTLADVDRNGKLDVIAASVQDRTYLPLGEKSLRKNRSSLYIWELDTPYAVEVMPWPAFQAGPEHTGAAPIPERPLQPPVVAEIPHQIVPPGAAFFPIELDQYVEDPDHHPGQITWSIEGQLELRVTIATNRVVNLQLPNPAWVGKETLRFVASDPDGLQSEVSAIFEVRPGYIAPVAVSDHKSTDEEVPVDIDVVANDFDPLGQSLRVAGFSKPRLGRITKTPTGTLVYTPKKNAQGMDTFSYFLSNGNGGVSMGTVTVEIVPINDPPVAVPDHLVIDEDTLGDIDVLANDTDPDEHDSLTLLHFSEPLNGTVVAGPGGVLEYVPKADFYGLDMFAYSITDTGGATNEGTVSIMVKPVNDRPVAETFSFILNRNSSQNITFAATDADDPELTFTVVESPKNGTLWTYPTVATYYPTNGFVGVDYFTYKANDGKEDGPIATVTLTVLDANNPPEALDQSVVTKVNQPAPLHLAATDLDNDPLTYELLSRPEHGELSGSGTNYIYQPNLGFLGLDEFKFQASDGKETSREATLTITVTDQNTPPAAEDFTVRTLVNTATNITLRASDLELNPLQYHVVTRPINGKVTGKGQVLLYSPNSHFIGSDRFTFKANDGEWDSPVATVSIVIDPVNHAPVATNQQVVILKNTPAPINLAVQDPDGDLLNCPILKGPKHGRLSGLGSSLTYTPKADFTGSDSFTYQAWDGQTYSRQGTVSISVTATPPAPQLAFDSISVLPDGTVHLIVSPSDHVIEVLVSSDLIHWTHLLTHPTDGGRSFFDIDAPEFRQRFYRAQLREVAQ